MAIHDELKQKKAVTEKLSRELEDPGNPIRWSRTVALTIGNGMIVISTPAPAPFAF